MMLAFPASWASPAILVYHNKADVGSLYGHLGTHDGEFLHPLLHFGLAADAGGVNEHIAAVLIFKEGVHRVPGGTGHIADYQALFPKDMVYQG